MVARAVASCVYSMVRSSEIAGKLELLIGRVASFANENENSLVSFSRIETHSEALKALKGFVPSSCCQKLKFLRGGKDNLIKFLTDFCEV